MATRAMTRRQSDRGALFALAYSGSAAFVILLLGRPDPALFLPVGLAALPFAASRRSALAFRLLAAALLAAFALARGGGEGLAFLPAVAGLLYSAARALPRRDDRPRRRR